METKGSPGTMRRVAASFRPYWGRLVMLGLVAVLAAGLNVGSLLLIKPVRPGAILPGLPKPSAAVLAGGGGMVVIPVVTGALGIWQPSQTRSGSG
jgi:hypothetical protein